MLSLSPIFPRDTRTQSNSFASSLFRPPSPPSIFDHPSTQSTHPHAPHQQQRPRLSQPHRNIHTHLTNQANALSARRAAIARFGATWLRPPGCPKTLQALGDEAAEREEQEMLARREREVLEQQMAAEEVERQIRRQQAEVRGVLESQGDGMGRDLDEEVPEGEDVGMGIMEDDEDEEDDDDDGDELAGGHGRGQGGAERDLDEDMEPMGNYFDDGDDDLDELNPEYGEAPDQTVYTEASMPHLQPDMDIDRDLDASIPEADRSWQHTDTDVEDTSSFVQPSSQRQYEYAVAEEREVIRHARAVHVRGNGSVRMSAERAGMVTPGQGTPSLLDSSWIGSSPAFARTTLPPGRGGGTGNAFRNRLMREAGRGG